MLLNVYFCTIIKLLSGCYICLITYELYTHLYRSSRLARAESVSSGEEEEDDEGFHLLTAENLFSTLLHRVSVNINIYFLQIITYNYYYHYAIRFHFVGLRAWTVCACVRTCLRIGVHACVWVFSSVG